MSGPYVFVDDLALPVLDGHDHHHLVRVLRRSPGDPLTVSDGAGCWAPAVLGDSEGAVELTGTVVEDPPPPYELTIAFAPVKGDRPEWAVQKLSEIGVDRIVPIHAERSVVRWDEARAVKQVTKLRRIAREAAMQSRRSRLPAIDDVAPLASLLGEPGTVMAEPGGPPPRGSERLLLVGPEGGWSPTELEGANRTVGLGPNVLRAETASVVGAALLVALREQIVAATTDCG